jgi:hypothetical protein
MCFELADKEEDMIKVRIIYIVFYVMQNGKKIRDKQ